MYNRNALKRKINGQEYIAGDFTRETNWKIKKYFKLRKRIVSGQKFKTTLQTKVNELQMILWERQIEDQVKEKC